MLTRPNLQWQHGSPRSAEQNPQEKAWPSRPAILCLLQGDPERRRSRSRMPSSASKKKIDRRMPTGILGQEATQSATNDADQFLATQIKLIQADAVLRPVALKFKLRELENEDWDARKIKEAEVEDTPVILKKLKVTRPPNTYLLLI